MPGISNILKNKLLKRILV